MNPVKNHNNENTSKQSGGFNYKVIGSPVVGRPVNAFPGISRPIVGHPYDIDLLRQRFSSLNNHPFTNPQDHLLQNLLFLLLIKSSLKDKKSKSKLSQFDQMLDHFNKNRKYINIRLNVKSDRKVYTALTNLRNVFTRMSEFNRGIYVYVFNVGTDHQFTDKIYDKSLKSITSGLKNNMKKKINDEFMPDGTKKKFKCKGLKNGRTIGNTTYLDIEYDLNDEMKKVRDNLLKSLQNAIGSPLSTKNKDGYTYYYDNDGIILRIADVYTSEKVFIPILSTKILDPTVDNKLINAIKTSNITDIKTAMDNYGGDKKKYYEPINNMCSSSSEKEEYGVNVVLNI